MATKQSRLPSRKQSGLLRGACHRARVRATRWLAMTNDSTFSLRRRDRLEWLVGLFAPLIGWPLMNAVAIGLRVVADADAVSDCPVETGGEQDVRAGELIAHQI